MNRADSITLFRTFLVFVIVLMVLAKLTPWAIIPTMTAYVYGEDGAIAERLEKSESVPCKAPEAAIK